MFFLKKAEPTSWIAVFLGNPGVRYENTRHNAGYMAAGFVEKSAGIKISRVKFNALTTTAAIGGKRVFLMKPQTYMNLSGVAVSQAMRFYRVPLCNVITVSDDVSLEAGKIRVRRSGSAGGHKGLKDIIGKCGGEDFPRIKIGVGSPPGEHQDLADWVLAKLSGTDLKTISDAAAAAAKALELILSGGIDRAMAKYN